MSPKPSPLLTSPAPLKPVAPTYFLGFINKMTFIQDRTSVGLGPPPHPVLPAQMTNSQVTWSYSLLLFGLLGAPCYLQKFRLTGILSFRSFLQVLLFTLSFSPVVWDDFLINNILQTVNTGFNSGAGNGRKGWLGMTRTSISEMLGFFFF